MNTLTFRSAVPEDLFTLNYISRASKQHWGYPDEWIEHWRQALEVTEVDIRKGRVVVAQRTDTIVGFSKILENREQYEIDHLFIHPDHIGKGYGRQLLATVLEACGDSEVIVVSDPNSERFYQKMGFVTYDQVESYPPGRYLPVMRLDKAP